jgi:DNA-binding transcriptional regulator YiaG
LTAWKHRAEKELIANATVIDEKLFVISCEPQTIEIPFDSIKSLARIPRKQRSDFSISDDGSYIHWPDADIHLDLSAIRSVVDPNWRDECAARTAAHNRMFGRRVAALRRSTGLRQTDVAGLSERQIRRIEGGEAPTADALRLLAAAHGLDLATYLDAVAHADSVGAETAPVSEAMAI